MIEDELRAAMHAHDHEAPTAANLRPAVRRDRRIPAVAATIFAVAAVVVAVTLLWTRDRSPGRATAASGPLACPAHQTDVSVPAQAAGVDASTRLAPNQRPRKVLICSYDRVKNAPLGGRRVLNGDLDRVTTTLTWAPRNIPNDSAECGLVALGASSKNYLLGLTYPSGTEWISVPGDGCGQATNGMFATYVDIHTHVAQAYASGSWPATNNAPGRWGQERAIVPDEPTTLRIATEAKNPQVQTLGPRTTGDFSTLISMLNAAPASKQSTCDVGTGVATTIYVLTFGYPHGPDVRVDVGGDCLPNVWNGSRETDGAKAVIPLIKELLSQR